MKAIKYICLQALFALFGAVAAQGQVNGGRFAMEFLRMANSPHVTAMGGIAVASPTNDISFAPQNPALMRPGLHNQLAVSYNNFYNDISIANLQYGYHIPKINTSFFTAIQYLNYGTFAATDFSGVQNGTFRAADYAITVGASRKYLAHWRYGASLKWAQSSLYTNQASALLMDVGINYYDTSSLWDIGLVAKNMGAMVKTYNTANGAEPLPFDLQLGVSKRFKHMPLRLFTTLHHLYEWDIRYNNPNDLITNSIIGGADTQKATGSKIGDKLFRHFIFGAELSIGKHIVLTASYNVLRRREMVLSTKAGLTGFALGGHFDFNKFQIHWSRSYYYVVGPYSEVGLNLRLNKLLPLGASGKKMHWDTHYPDWE
jgi:hypothetical protein